MRFCVLLCCVNELKYFWTFNRTSAAIWAKPASRSGQKSNAKCWDRQTDTEIYKTQTIKTTYEQANRPWDSITNRQTVELL